MASMKAGQDGHIHEQTTPAVTAPCSTPRADGAGSPSIRERCRASLVRAVSALRSLQREDGHFCGELQGDSILASEYLLMKFILGQEAEPMADGADGPETLARIANELRHQQREDGSWGQYPGAGVDLSASVKGYFALKLMGDDPDAPHMQAAREVILAHGGAERCNSFSKFYLACLGQVSWNAVPAIPPEIVFIPRWFYFHLTKVSAWTRTMILPLSLVVTLRPTRQLPPERGIAELFSSPAGRDRMINLAAPPPHWNVFFLGVDRALKLMHRVGGTPLRRVAIQRAERWILQRAGQDGAAATDGLGAIFPPMVYLQVAFAALGYDRDHEVIRRAERELDEFFIEEGDRIRLQPCFSPVWDTGIALYALTDCGLDHADHAVTRAADWLRSKQCDHVGDWETNVDGPEGAGWFFEYHNAWYPDCDDTAMVAMALRRAGGAENHESAQRGVQWMLSMQNRDGGWAAFDRTVHRQILEYVPFADHNAMQDPSCPDITGRVLECLAWHGFTNRDEPVRHAIDYVRAHQGPEGCWFGRWGVNYIYGTWQAVVGPIRCGEDPTQPWIRRAGRWLKSIQKADGSFGESANSYEDPSLKGQGPSTASQTAWAAMTLQEIFGHDDPDLGRAIRWLIETQLDDADADDPQRNPDRDPAGSWAEPWFTGTGFPRVFYLRYHLYRLYFPIMAMGRFLHAHGVALGTADVARLKPKMPVERAEPPLVDTAAVRAWVTD
ncbi:MAG: squalene--hopene cyclase [Planctomycetota bacterium]|jgi:squalene-hopene/tetraprenyl-beta-curcumene cyclase